ncbi:hypothetical protein GUJ93_ZPchr0012g20514 [Zizania palustris]|uniref:Bifunctional inhibitor/plant lipid transfer protein/seed storage helical domain-containing protein n=1 Tax=Zizania palustris TaxID=103762 RepID=A0A8J6BR59_ZIZPA|nr:hypothetical protein GUJ93_ZPchr0012g20514 [Zizania palustris]
MGLIRRLACILTSAASTLSLEDTPPPSSPPQRHHLPPPSPETAVAARCCHNIVARSCPDVAAARCCHNVVTRSCPDVAAAAVRNPPPPPKLPPLDALAHLLLSPTHPSAPIAAMLLCRLISLGSQAFVYPALSPTTQSSLRALLLFADSAPSSPSPSRRSSLTGRHHHPLL